MYLAYFNMLANLLNATCNYFQFFLFISGLKYSRNFLYLAISKITTPWMQVNCKNNTLV